MRGFGIAFMMSPVLSLAVRGLQGKDMAQGVGLFNMIRQLGGAIGVALLNVYITHQNAINRSNLLGYANQYDIASSNRIQSLTQTCSSAGYSTDDAQMLAYGSLNNTLAKQQALISYNQGFWLIAMCLVFCIPMIFLIRYKKGEKLGKASDH